MKTRHIPLLLILPCLLFFNLSCSDDEENTITGTGTPTFNDPALEAMATQGAVVAQGLIDNFPAWAQGTPGKRDTTTPTWNPICSCWNWSSYENDESNPSFTWFRNQDFALTFFQNEVPQMEFAGTDMIQMDTNYGYNTYGYSDEMNYSDTHLSIQMIITTVDFSGAAVVATGSGNGSFSGSYTHSGETTYINKNFVTELNMTIPIDGSCPTGTFEMNSREASFSINFEGTAIAQWIYITGPDQSQSGPLTFQCGK